MTPRASLALLVFAMACPSRYDKGNDSNISRLGGNPLQVTITVTDGWTRAAVPGASVTSATETARTDAAGTVKLMTNGPCVTVTVVAAGFLDRRTCTSNLVTLWPVADASEAEAIRSSVFLNGMFSSEWWNGTIYVRLDGAMAQRNEVVEAWRNASAAIGQLTGDRVSFTLTDNPSIDTAFVIADLNSGVCRPEPVWPSSSAGFCLESALTWDPDRILIAADRAADPIMAQRALLSLSVLRPHALPGFLNRDQPGPELSEFERRTLHMVGLRRTHTIIWPDFDQ